MPMNRLSRLRVYQCRMVDGEMVDGHASDIWQEQDGSVHTSGIWEGIVPVSPEDVEIYARRNGVDPIHEMKRRLLSCSSVRVEVVE